jgi:hypothetical protein
LDQSLIVLLQAFLKTKKLPNESAKDYMSKWALAVRYSGIGDDPEDRSWVETRLHGKCFTCRADNRSQDAVIRFPRSPRQPVHYPVCSFVCRNCVADSEDHLDLAWCELFMSRFYGEWRSHRKVVYKRPLRIVQPPPPMVGYPRMQGTDGVWYVQAIWEEPISTDEPLWVDEKTQELKRGGIEVD